MLSGPLWSSTLIRPACEPSRCLCFLSVCPLQADACVVPLRRLSEALASDRLLTYDSHYSYLSLGTSGAQLGLFGRQGLVPLGGSERVSERGGGRGTGSSRGGLPSPPLPPGFIDRPADAMRQLRWARQHSSWF